MNHFELFQLPVALDIDLAALKTIFKVATTISSR
jgi:hypothetical protein